MSRPCLMCQHNQHEVCIDVGCICLVCYDQDKDQDPIPFPK